MNWIKENISTSPSFSPFLEQIELIEANVITNPTLCVETCKALVEGICKTILENRQVEYSSSIQFHILVQDTLKCIFHIDEPFRNDLTELGRRIASIAQKIGEIRNGSGFSSHGMDVLNPKLTETLSLFCYRISDTIGGFILNCYCNNLTTWKDYRLHYEDCVAFNDYFDGLYSINTGIITISASKALFLQDYEAYKESYFEFIDSVTRGDIE